MNVLRHPISRRVFLLVWATWSIIGIVFALFYDLWHETGFWLGAPFGVISMVMLTRMEIRYRHRHLPPEARRPSLAILALLILPVPITLVLVGQKYQNHLPWSDPMRDTCLLRVSPQTKGDRDVELKYQYQWEKSNWGTSIRTRRYSETRIWNNGAPGRSWIIDPDLRQARSSDPGDGENVIVLSRSGYEELFNRLAMSPRAAPLADESFRVSDEQVSRGASLLGDWMTKRDAKSRVGYSEGLHYRFVRASSAVGLGRASLWPWLWVAAIVFSLCLFLLMWILVEQTMFPGLARV